MGRRYIAILGHGESVDPSESRSHVRTVEFTGVRIKGRDGTTIAFSASSDEANTFVQQLRSEAGIDAAKMTEA